MKPIMDRCSALTERLERLKKAMDDEHKALVLEARRAELEALKEELGGVATTAKALLEHEHLTATDLPDCNKSLESIDKVGERLETEPTELTKGRDYKHLLGRVGKVQEHLAATTTKRWETVVAHHQGVDEAFLRRVEVFPDQSDRVARIRLLKAAFEATTRNAPASEEAYTAFTSSYDALQQELSQLDPEAFPDDVLRFLRAAQKAKGAPLKLFTDKVQTWLKESDLLDGVRVRFMGEG